ncbi:hypothetical protein SSS_06281 [Sarcoptes scabiei]|nr:hypothetical protein SSS_06281 [Sarcoptes scabiei]
MIDSIVKPTSMHLFKFPGTESIEKQFEKINSNLKSLSSSIVMDEKLEQLQDLWPSSKEIDNVKRLHCVQSRAKIYASKIRESWLMLHKDKQIKSLNHNEEELHQLEKLKLENYCKKLNILVSKEINPCDCIADKLEEWYQGAQVAYVKPKLIITELLGFFPALNELETSLKTAYEENNKIWINLFKEVRNFEIEWSQAQRSLESPTSTPKNIPMMTNELPLIECDINGGNGDVEGPEKSNRQASISTVNLLKELQNLNEYSRMLKDAFKDFEMTFSEVQSFND